MRRALYALVSLAFAPALLAPAAHALQKCAVGQKVTMPGGKVGTVSKTQGSGCTVKDDKGLESTWAAFMLDPGPGEAAASPAIPGQPKAGKYQCYGGAAGNFKLEFRSGNAYANDKGAVGAYAFNKATADIDFKTGPWAGFFGRSMPDGDVGMTGRADRSYFSITCERQTN